MKHEYPLMDLDIARIWLRWGVAILEVFCIASAEGHSCPANFADALYGVHDYLRTVSDEISESVDDCFVQRRAEKEMKA